MRSRILRTSVLMAAVYITVCLVLFPNKCIDAAINALALCGNAVVPTLFPFFVCSSLFISLGLASLAARRLGGVMRKLFKIGGAGAVAVVLGVMSGYPVGAKCAADLYQKHKISKAEAERLLAFCNNSGPMFVIGVVGSVIFGSARIGIILYIIHVLSSLLTGILCARLFGGDTADTMICESRSDDGSVFSALSDAVSGASMTILKVCGFVVFFAVVGATLPEFGGYAFIMSFLEITSGIKALSALPLDINILLPIVSFFLALSGVSVLLQAGAVISDTDLSVRPYIIGKLFQALIAFAVTAAACVLLPITANASAAVFAADTGLWYASGAIEACGWCAALIVALCIFLGRKSVN